jgi:hypothetical protein
VKGIITVLALISLAGCAGFVPMEELESRAFVTGDWSLVEQRERLIERRKLRSYMQCAPGYIGYCQEDFGRKGCSCVVSAVVNEFLVSH